ncbi:MAG TPA: DUF5017 domain-containing protein [Flavobacterium sp.]|jgi:hypothetical protein|nr:DUF5017 domain-containing protein [Flavobacterium sp.]
MKNYISKIIFAFITLIFFSGCSDEDTSLPPMYPAVYSEDFSRPETEPPFDFEDWTLFSEAGTKTWFKNDYQGNDYIEFSSFGSGEASNIGWAVSPAYDLETTGQKALIFQSAQHHATSLDNKFELLISSNYDGENVLKAKWTTLKFNLPTYTSSTNYDFVNSGRVNLESYSGKVYIAFRVTGNGLQNSNQAGGFQVDNIKLF